MKVEGTTVKSEMMKGAERRRERKGEKESN